MAKIVQTNDPLSIAQIEQFELENAIVLTDLYKEFLLANNGGKARPNVFKVSDDQGPTVLNVFYGIGDMYDSIEENVDMLDERLPEGFIPIGEDPGGNVICLGTKAPHYESIYFWDHENESENPNDMSNMYFLASDVYEFLDKLYDDTKE